MIRNTTAASLAALLAIAGTAPGFAQSAASGKQGMGGMSLTCRDLASLDQDQARSVIYWLNGYAAANTGVMSNQQASGTAATGSGSAATDTTGSTSSADATTGAAASSGTSGTTADSGAATGTSGDSTSSSQTTADNAGAASANPGTSGSASSSGANTITAQLPGYQNIDVAGIMSQCASNPDMRLADMIHTGAGTGAAQ